MANKFRKLGRHVKLHLATTFAASTWTAVDTKTTLARNESRNTEDVTADDSGDQQWNQPININRTLTGTMFDSGDAITDDAALKILQDAIDGNTAVTVALADGPIATAGTKYRKMELYVSELSTDYPSGGAVKASFTLIQGPTANIPTTVTVAS